MSAGRAQPERTTTDEQANSARVFFMMNTECGVSGPASVHSGTGPARLCIAEQESIARFMIRLWIPNTRRPSRRSVIWCCCCSWCRQRRAPRPRYNTAADPARYRDKDVTVSGGVRQLSVMSHSAYRSGWFGQLRVVSTTAFPQRRAGGGEGRSARATTSAGSATSCRRDWAMAGAGRVVAQGPLIGTAYDTAYGGLRFKS